jgi:uncharacterized protein (DUF58 family)
MTRPTPDPVPDASHPNARLYPRTGWYLPAEGRTWVLTTALLLSIGIFKNINLLTLLGFVLLAVQLVNAPSAWWRLRGLAGRRRIPDFLVAGEPCLVKISVRRASGPLPGGIVIEDHGPWLSAEARKDAVQAAGEGPDQAPVVLLQRGRHTWGPLIATSGYPFGLVRRRVVLVEGQEVTILPRLGRVQRGLLRRHLRGVDPRAERIRRQALRHRSAQDEFHGLREYRTGDSPRWIHWRTSARHGDLMVREFEDLPGNDLLIVLDAAAYLPSEDGESVEFEAAVSLAATLCWEWCRHRGDRLTLGVAGADPIFLGGLTTADLALQTLLRLAVVRPGPGTQATETTLERLADLTPPSASVLLIAHGQPSLLEPLRRRLERPITFLDTQQPDQLDFYTPPGARSEPHSDRGEPHAS